MNRRTLDSASRMQPSLSHLVLRTEDLDATIDWYRKVLDMQVVFRSEGGAALTCDAEHHRLALIEIPPGSPVTTGPGLEHVAFKLPNIAAWLAAYQRLGDQGLFPEICLHHWATMSMYYRDPNNVQVELFIDTVTSDRATDYMATPDFAANPIGSVFNPADLARRYLEGEALDSLCAQPPFDPEAFAAVLEVGGGMSTAAENAAHG